MRKSSDHTIKNNLLAALKEGRITKETEQYKRKFYKVLSKAEDYIKKMRIGDLHLPVNKKDGTQTLENYYEENSKNRTTKDDEYELEFIINNIKNEINSLEVLSSGVAPEYEYTLKCKRKTKGGVLIEDYTDSVHIKDCGNEKLLEFFIPTYNMRFLEGDDFFKQMVNITELSFFDYSGEFYQYKINQYYKTVRIESATVIKFKATGGLVVRL